MAGAEAHGEASEALTASQNNTQIPSRAPDSPIPTALGLEDFSDEDKDSAEFQLTRTPSHSNDLANPGFPGLNLHCPEVASLDPEDSTQTQSSFPALPSLRASAGHYTLGSSGDYRAKNMTATSPARGGVSPSSSPRLPSPPPFTEVQIGPESPSVADANQNPFGDTARIDNGSTRRIRPGTKAADMDKGPPLVPLSEVDSAFQAQEYLLALYRSFTCDPSTGFSTPITRETAIKLATPPQMNGPETSTPYDRNLWLYELCRFLTIKANDVLVALFADNPPCTAQSCPEMRASEWQYLCAVHDPPKPCCAIDYCCHTLDWAGNVLSSPKYFASRLTLGEGGNAAASMRHLTNIFRRVYRIFAHAWFQHRGVFWQVEGRYGVYIFFKTVCDVYQLIPEDNYTIPAEAEGGNEEDRWEMKTPVSMPTSTVGQHKMQILTKDHNGHADDSGSQVQSPGKQQQHEQGSETTTTLSVGATTRRHKHTPSTGSHVTTIAEGTEEEDGSMFELRNAEGEDEDLGGAQGPGPSILSEHEETQPHPQGQGLLSEGSLGAHGLAKLDLSAESLPELRASEDPTPLAIHTIDPMSNLVTTSAGALYGYGEEGKQEIEDKMAGLTVGGGKGQAAKDVEGEPDLNAEENEKDEDLEKRSKSVMQDSQEVNIGEAERETNVEEVTTVAPDMS